MIENGKKMMKDLTLLYSKTIRDNNAVCRFEKRLHIYIYTWAHYEVQNKPQHHHTLPQKCFHSPCSS
jgi:hypothetical protein